jgi:hypothetical protein
MNDTPPLGLVDLPYYVVLSAPLVAEEMDREDWVRGLAERWGLVLTRPGQLVIV